MLDIIQPYLSEFGTWLDDLSGGRAAFYVVLLSVMVWGIRNKMQSKHEPKKPKAGLLGTLVIIIIATIKRWLNNGKTQPASPPGNRNQQTHSGVGDNVAGGQIQQTQTNSIGDQIGGDKIAGDKVSGNKTVETHHYHHT